MEPSLFDAEIERLFAAAVHRTRPGRAALLDAECLGRPDLRAEVESLLTAYDRSTGFIEPIELTPASLVQRAPTDARIGSRVGAFRLLEVLGEGGMGTVYRAERADGEFSQQVAIKFIGSWIRDRATVARFRGERQILASLQHPNIVSLLDGGVTAEGEAYLVMEYVDGQPITAYCHDRALNLEGRLGLFVRVCEAVQCAHAHLIVHRDLKPGNVLVTSAGVPKVVDFGVAKLLAPAAEDSIPITHVFPGPLTPDYASPEQLRSQPVTTACDVYALGVVLYELLTGSRPYDTSGKPLHEVLTLVLDVDPPAPSTRLRAQAAAGSMAASAVAGDLDAITLKAMQKEPAHRYASPADLADDVMRYLDGRPVLAQPARFAYRARKLARRHRVVVGAAAAAVLSLIVGLGAALWQAETARNERDRARLEAAKAQQVSAFLRALFTSNNPLEALGQKLTAPQLLERGVQRIDRELSGQPEVQASMLASLGSVYVEINLINEALPLLERSLAMREKIFGSDHVEVAESLHVLGRLKHRNMAEYSTAAQILSRAADILDRHPGSADHLLPPVLSELGMSLWRSGRYEEGRAALRRAVTLGEPRELRDLHKWLANLALLEQELGDFTSAETLTRRALALGERVEGRRGVPVGPTMLILGTLLRAQEAFDEARDVLEELNADEEKTWGTGRSYTWGELGDVYYGLGDLRRARDWLDRAIALGEHERNVAEHRDLARPLLYSGRLLLTQGQPAEALPQLERALRIRRRWVGDKHAEVADVLVEIARAKAVLEGAHVAEPLLRQALTMQRETLVPGHRFLVPTLLELGELVRSRGASEAQGLFQEALDIARKSLPERHSLRRRAEAAVAPRS